MFQTSLKSNLLISYLFFTFLLLFVGTSSYWYFVKLTEIQDVQKNIFKIIVNLSKLKEYETNFYANETSENNFYISNNSKNIKLFNQSVEQMQSDIFNLQSKSKYHAIETDNSITKIQQNLENYASEFNKITNLYKSRGFKDFGIEGEMRKKIHQIEKQFTSFNKVVLLTTRRIEKDYIIRKDYDYVRKMNEHKKIVLKMIVSNDSLKTLFNAYFENFNLLVLTDSQIGFTNQNGHKKIVNTYFHQLSKASTETEEIVNYNLNTLNNDIKVKFIAIVGISLCLALLMSFAFKKIIASNLSELLIAIETNKISYFKIIPTFSKISNITEFKIIQNKFIELATEVSIHTQDVETKNKELSNINFLLKSTVEELNLQKQELQKANTLKETFLSIISHDVRGPLLTLQKFLDIIIENPNLISNENKILHFKKLKDATDDQVILLQNLLNWSKTQNKEFRFTPTKINVLQMSFDVVRLLSPLANQKQISIENYTENEFVRADKNMTELILRNIISNAIKFTNIGGIITIQTHVFDDDLLTIEISDNGIGIKPEVLELLNNNNFYQTTEGTLKERGSGFGLMFCRAFTEKMGGKMHIHSIFGVGTKVTVELSLVKYGLVVS